MARTYQLFLLPVKIQKNNMLSLGSSIKLQIADESTKMRGKCIQGI